MKKRLIGALLTAVMGACFLAGCRQAPELSKSGEIPHAKSSVEQAVENTAAQSAEAVPEPGGLYDAVIGTQENGLWICAEIPAVPGTVNQLTLQPRDDLNEALLEVFLDSQNGEVRNITQEYLAEQEALLNVPPEAYNAGDGIETSAPAETAHFGDDSLLMLSDGERTASFVRNTTANYEDESLLQSCQAIQKRAQERNLTWSRENTGASFSLAQAQELLLEKLEPLGIAEISLSEIYYYELDGSAFYEILFTPSYEGIGIAHEFGQIGTTEVLPDAMAWVTADGVAQLHLGEILGKVTEQVSTGNILSFSQAADILAKYLESGTICGCAEAKLTQAELVYYPNYQDPQLILKPAWHICVPLQQRIESEDPAYNQLFENSAAWNIYLDAVTGELLRVE